MMKNTVILITFLFFTEFIFAQSTKKPLTHDDILKWERIIETVISNNGKIHRLQTGTLERRPNFKNYIAKSRRNCIGKMCDRCTNYIRFKICGFYFETC